MNIKEFIEQKDEITLADIEAWCNQTGEKTENVLEEIVPKLSISEYLTTIGAEDLEVIDLDILFNYTEGMGYWSFCLEDLSEIPNLKEVALVEGKRYFETVQTI